MKRGKLEPIDIEILKHLYRNPDLTYADMAKKIRTSSVTVYNRLRKLKENGVYRKTVVIPPTIFAKKVKAFIFVSTRPGKERAIADTFSKNPCVLRVKGITGDFDLLVELVADNVDELQKIVMESIRSLSGVVRTNTVIELFSSKDEVSYIPPS
ncbi:MAG: Lrp/AsnC family transcriptional regulator [Candidatus Bathyarchaeia archaeon]